MTAEPNPPAPKRAAIYQQGHLAGHLENLGDRKGWRFVYVPGYAGEAVSLTLPVRAEPYEFDEFPAVFEGLLPEGVQLEALLRMHKIDRSDSFRQLITVGHDMVGALTARDAPQLPTSACDTP
jgi:serine/threonine-protein kinase HipA